MDCPIHDLMDEDACSQFRRDPFPPTGLRCPRCHAVAGFSTQRSFREPVLDSRCPPCGRVFHAWTGTVFQGTPWRPSPIVLIRRGFAQGTPTAQRARELAGRR